MEFGSSRQADLSEDEQMGKVEVQYFSFSSSSSSLQPLPTNPSPWEHQHQMGCCSASAIKCDASEEEEASTRLDLMDTSPRNDEDVRSATVTTHIQKEHMFDKVVTPSDVGKLNRLVIPKQHAEKFFPLDSSSKEKGLLLNFEDRNGKPWRFRYSYWNSSQSYVMTKGWSRFVKDKKLHAGDIVSFQRGIGELGKDRLYIDWRRRPDAPEPTPTFPPPHHLSFHRPIPWNPLLKRPEVAAGMARDHSYHLLQTNDYLNRNSRSQTYQLPSFNSSGFHSKSSSSTSPALAEPTNNSGGGGVVNPFSMGSIPYSRSQPAAAVVKPQQQQVQMGMGMVATPQIIDLFRRKKLDESLLQRLKTTLLTINAVLSEAEEKQIANSFVKEWVDELKDATYHGENLLDEIDTALQYEKDAEKLKKFNTKLEKITSRLEHLAKQKDVLGLKESLGEKASPRLPTTCLVDESQVCGRDIDKEQIIRMLLESCLNENDIPVIAIVGIGGIGKTTLAQLLYNDSRVQGHFSRRAWAYVSEEFDMFKVTKTILESVSSRYWNFEDLNLIQVNLKARLTGQRFLLVLDDVWDKDFINCDILQNSFRAAAKGSRIIVTTRSQDIASTMRPAFTYRLRQLSEKDGWSVFATQLKDQGAHLHPDLKVIGEKIVKKCEGLPLALKTLGSVLHSKIEAHEWYKILNSKIWDLPIHESNILPSLRLSYYYLPSHLKQCFAYCSIFPKGYEFEKEKLILLWMAECFLLQTRNEKTMEEVGREYFGELFSRSFFQQKSNGDKVRYIMHDLVNELAHFASVEFSFNFEGDHKPHDIPEKVRHLSYLRSRQDSLQKFKALASVSSSSGTSCNLDKTIIKTFLRVVSLQL